MDPAKARQCFDLSMQLGGTPAFRHPWLRQVIGELAKHAASAVPRNSHLELALAAIEFPLPSELQESVPSPDWPEPFRHLHPFNDPVERRPSAPRIQDLLRAVRLDDGGRANACLRLHTLNRCKMLSPDEAQSFGAALWKFTDRHDSSLPGGTQFLAYAFHDLPAPEGVNVFARIRSQLFTFPQDLLTDSACLFNLQHAASSGLANLAPEPRIALELFERLAHPTRYDSSVQAIAQKYKDASFMAGVVIVRWAVPCMTADMRTEERALALIELTETGGLWTAIPALSQFENLTESTRRRIVERIRAGVLGTPTAKSWHRRPPSKNGSRHRHRTTPRQPPPTWRRSW